ncbi:MAG: ABC transporter permease subunit [Clostridia bacterium]|nr:ABC transporter permease subunit [Clostridia bacterium]
MANKIGNNTGDLSSLTKDQLWEMEQAKLGKKGEIFFILKSLLPILGLAVSILEYVLVPNKYGNQHPERYIIFLIVPVVIYCIRWIITRIQYQKGNRQGFIKVAGKAPFLFVLHLAFAVFDYLTLKTGILLYPFIPWINDIINAMILDRAQLLKCAIASIKLLFTGYFAGVALGIITGIACGYSEKINYWINPILKVLGPIPTATWIPLIMIIAKSLKGGSIFIIGLGTWFMVTVATRTGISNVDRAYYDVARTLGAKERQLVFSVAIPHAMPNILQGMTQGMSSACVSLMIAEMMGVKAGLGWYITWSTAWAAYNKMFAAIIIICITFSVVTKALDMIKNYLLRWQIGVTK